MILKHQEFYSSLEDTLKFTKRCLSDYKKRCLKQNALDRYQRQDINLILKSFDTMFVKIELLKSSFPDDPYVPDFDDPEFDEIPF